MIINRIIYHWYIIQIVVITVVAVFMLAIESRRIPFSFVAWCKWKKLLGKKLINLVFIRKWSLIVFVQELLTTSFDSDEHVEQTVN